MNRFEIEEKCALVKSVLVKMAQLAREKKPDHENTRLLSAAERYFYEVSEEMFTLLSENERLIDSVEGFSDVESEPTETKEHVEIEVKQPLNDEDWLKRPLRNSDEAAF